MFNSIPSRARSNANSGSWRQNRRWRSKRRGVQIDRGSFRFVFLPLPKCICAFVSFPSRISSHFHPFLFSFSSAFFVSLHFRTSKIRTYPYCDLTGTLSNSASPLCECQSQIHRLGRVEVDTGRVEEIPIGIYSSAHFVALVLYIYFPFCLRSSFPIVPLFALSLSFLFMVFLSSSWFFSHFIHRSVHSAFHLCFDITFSSSSSSLRSSVLSFRFLHRSASPGHQQTSHRYFLLDFFFFQKNRICFSSLPSLHVFFPFSVL